MKKQTLYNKIILWSICLAPSAFGMIMAFLYNGDRGWHVAFPPYVTRIIYPFGASSFFYSWGNPTRLEQTLVNGLFFLPYDFFVFICICFYQIIQRIIKYWRKNKVVFLVHGLSNFDVIGKYVSACGDEIPLSLVFEEAGRLYWKKLFFQLSGAKLMFTVFLGHEDRVIHFCADHFELPDNSRSDVAVLLTRVNDGCQLRIFVAPAGSLSAYKDHDDLCKTLDERFTTCPRTEVGHGRDSKTEENEVITGRCYLTDCRKI